MVSGYFKKGTISRVDKNLFCSVSVSQVTMEAGGLPLELWRMILAYLPLPDLGRCSLVCRAWREFDPQSRQDSLAAAVSELC